MQNWTKFLKEESGQATTEYILMLAVVTSLCVMVLNNLLAPVLKRFGQTIGTGIQSQLSRNLYYFRVGG